MRGTEINSFKIVLLRNKAAARYPTSYLMRQRFWLLFGSNLGCDTGYSDILRAFPHSFQASRFKRVLTMVYHTQSYWVFGLFPSYGIQGTRKHDVSEIGSVSFLRCGGKTPTQLSPLDIAQLNHNVSRCLLPTPEEGNRSSFRNKVFPIL
jgi:hypothetical protein